MKTRTTLMITGFMGALAVALGALGAHTLENKISTGLITKDQTDAFNTAVEYQMYHTLAMLLLFLLSKHLNSKLVAAAFNLFFIGIILFSGSIYLLTTRELLGAEWLRYLGPVTPIGGICFIAGWICVAFTFRGQNR